MERIKTSLTIQRMLSFSVMFAISWSLVGRPMVGRFGVGWGRWWVRGRWIGVVMGCVVHGWVVRVGRLVVGSVIHRVVMRRTEVVAVIRRPVSRRGRDRRGTSGSRSIVRTWRRAFEACRGCRASDDRRLGRFFLPTISKNVQKIKHVKKFFIESMGSDSFVAKFSRCRSGGDEVDRQGQSNELTSRHLQL